MSDLLHKISARGELKFPKISLFVLRVSMGWLMLYAGITKILDPNWTAEGYLRNAKTFAGFYAMLADSSFLPFINFINEWGLTLLGLSLILGIFVRLSSVFGIVLMLLYYFPVLEFPYIPGGHAFIVDDHIIYASILFFFATSKPGRIWGLETWCSNLPICSKYPKIRTWLG